MNIYFNKIENHNTFASLHPDLKSDDNPTDIINIVPYEKGYQLLLYMEQLISEQHFKIFLKFFINYYKYSSIDYTSVKYLFESFVYHLIEDEE